MKTPKALLRAAIVFPILLVENCENCDMKTPKALRAAIVFPILLALMVPLMVLQATCVIVTLGAVPVIWAVEVVEAIARKVAGEAGPVLVSIFLPLAVIPLLAIMMVALLAP